MCFSFSSSTRKRFITIIIFCYIWSIFSPIIPPLAQAFSFCRIQNSQFPPRPTCSICPTCRTRPTIHNSPPPLYFSIRLPSSSYLNVQPCHFLSGSHTVALHPCGTIIYIVHPCKVIVLKGFFPFKKLINYSKIK